jgi:DNA repair exonuclease SbcCD ATPase subunit
MSTSTLNFEWVEVLNFKSYRGTHKFSFPQTPGLYLLTGKNLTQPRLGANDCGKTSLLDAAFWALYGRTPRGLRAGDVICHGEHTASVTLCFRVGHDKYVAARRQAPNSLTLNDKAVSQEALIKTFRLTPDQFQYSVMHPQFGEAFFDLAPSGALSVFSQIMGLNFWLERSELAATEAAELTGLITKRDDEISRKEGQFMTLEADVAQLEKQIAVDHKKPIALLEAKLAQATQATQTAGATWQKLNSTKMLTENDLLHVQETLDNISKVGAKCPTCLQSVSAAHLLAEKKRLGVCLTELKTHRRSIVAHCEASLAEVRSCERDIAAIEQNLRDFRRKQAEYDTLARLAAQKQGQLAELKASLTVLLNELDKLRSRQKAVAFWVSGFKRIRLFLIDETLRQLEIEVNNNLASLGLPDWRIQFDVERETKAGTISKGFVIMVYPPGFEKPLRFEAWGGGATQRLRLAGDFGLADLIMDQAGFTNTLEVFDEPSQHLSQEGLLDLLDTLQQRAIEDNKVIFIVDHHALDYGFDGTFTVIKDKTGSRVE